jgi:hypothetical protein
MNTRFFQVAIAAAAATIGALMLTTPTHAAAPRPEQASLNQATHSTISDTRTISGSVVSPVAVAIADHYTVPVASIVTLHESGVGYGNIVKLHEYAQASGKTVEEIQAMRESGMGWGKIRKDLALPKDAAKTSLGDIRRGKKIERSESPDDLDDEDNDEDESEDDDKSDDSQKPMDRVAPQQPGTGNTNPQRDTKREERAVKKTAKAEKKAQKQTKKADKKAKKAVKKAEKKAQKAVKKAKKAEKKQVRKDAKKAKKTAQPKPAKTKKGKGG